MSQYDPVDLAGNMTTERELREAKVRAGDGIGVALYKLGEHRAQEQEKRIRESYGPEPVVVGIPILDTRTQYEKDRDSARLQNGVRMAVILLMVGVLFWVLNSTIGNGIRGMDFYGVKDSYTFYPNALASSSYSDYYVGRADSETAVAKQSALDFATKYGSLFKPGTPFERMFDSCKGKFSCTDVSLGAVLNIQRHALKPQSLLNDMCSLEASAVVKRAQTSYAGPLDARFVPSKVSASNMCVTTNPSQVQAVATPLNTRYKLYEASYLLLVPLVAFLALVSLVPKAQYPVKGG